MKTTRRRAFLCFALSAILIAAGVSGWSAPAIAVETQPGDACTLAETDFHRTVGGPENPGAGLLLVCDGTTWNMVYEYDNNANLGVKQTAPKAPLHVGGEAIIGNTGLTCDADRAGGLRWSSSDSTIEMCNGIGWQKIVASVSTVNLVLSPPSKNNMDVDGTCGTATCTGTTVDFTLQNQGSLTSATITVTLTNTANFTKISDTCNGVTLAPNQVCVIQVQPKATGNLTYTGNLQITANNSPFAILQGTASGFGCTPGRQGGGGIYAACNLTDPESGQPYDLIVMPGGCPGTTLNPVCSGGTDAYTTIYGTGCCNSTMGLNGTWSETFGAKVSETIMQAQSVGGGTYSAVSYCANMVYNGKSDWYLPARAEMAANICPSKASIGGFANAKYWGSPPGAGNDASASDFTSCTFGDGGAINVNYRVRCARRENLPLPASATDIDPNNVTFTKVETATPSARILSAALAITGFLQPVSVDVTSNTGNPKVKINGGAEVSSGSISTWNQTVQLVMDAPATAGSNTMTLTIGSDSYTWKVTLLGSSNSCKRILDTGGSTGDGVYTIDPDGSGGLGSFSAYCDMTTDGGGWTLILNYSHQANTTPALHYRSNDLPVMGADVLGTNESGTSYWGHAVPALLGVFPTINELRYYCRSSGHSRVIHFKTGHAGTLTHVITGLGSHSGIQSSYTPLNGHNANLPTAAASFMNDLTNDALVSHTMYMGGTYHFLMNYMPSNRWECDDYPNNSSRDTIHRVWAR